jgi:hypothetical protein
MSILGLVVSFILFSLIPLEFEIKFVKGREREKESLLVARVGKTQLLMANALGSWF